MDNLDIKGVVLFSGRRLGYAQRIILSNCMLKIRENGCFTLEDIHALWLTTKPVLVWESTSWYRRSDGTEERRDSSRPYTVEEQYVRAKDWFMRHLGALVMKGYLKVLPNMKFIDQLGVEYDKRG